MKKYYPYTEWEDYNAGMWKRSPNEEEDLKKAIEFTADYTKYGEAMMEVSKVWTKTFEHHLNEDIQNNKAFVGHCAVMYKLNIPEYITRQAWGFLTDEQRRLANLEAQKCINKFKSRNEYQQGVFEF